MVKSYKEKEFLLAVTMKGFCYIYDSVKLKEYKC